MKSKVSNVNYKFNEGALIQELQNYIDKTYEGHYSKNKFQSIIFILSKSEPANMLLAIKYHHSTSNLVKN